MKSSWEKSCGVFGALLIDTRSGIIRFEINCCGIKYWKAHLMAIATIYRGSAFQCSELQKIAERENLQLHHFSAYFEVRFVKHLVDLSKLCEKICQP